MPRYLFIPLMYPRERRKLDFMFAPKNGHGVENGGETNAFPSNDCNRNEMRIFIGRSELIFIFSVISRNRWKVVYSFGREDTNKE